MIPIAIIAGAVIGGALNWAANGGELSMRGLGYFGVGAVAGGLSGGIGAGVSAALAGGGFMAGALSASTVAVTSTGFVAGAIAGSAGGLAGGFVSGFGNSINGGNGVHNAWHKGLGDGGMGALTGGLIGGITGGIDAANSNLDFWTGQKSYRVAVTLNPDGSATDKLSERDFLRGRPREMESNIPDEINFRRTTNSNGTWTTELDLPRTFRMDGFFSNSELGYMDHSLSGNVLSVHSLDRAQNLTAVGSRYFGRPISNLSDLIGMQKSSGFLHYGYLAFSTLWGRND